MTEQKKQPLVYYVDDEPRNLTVFEASFGSDIQIKVFDDPIKGLKALDQDSPWVIVSDQRMPSMSGVEFLELASKIKPNAVRIIVTGYSDERLVIESVRKAQIFDYIPKPWDPELLETGIIKAVDYYKLNVERHEYLETLQKRERELTENNLKLEKMMNELRDAKEHQSKMRIELESWVPPFVLKALNQPGIHFPRQEDIVCLTMDIVNSSSIHRVDVGGKPIRSKVIQIFSECVIRNGGWRESMAGDSAYAHFGLLDSKGNASQGAMAAANEFRVALRSMAKAHKLDIECGIGIHTAKQALVDLHNIVYQTPTGLVSQKSVDTTSVDVDLVHRIEKLAHRLPGSNIMMTKAFITSLGEEPARLVSLGAAHLKGQPEPVEIFLIPSDLVKPADIAAIKDAIAQDNQLLKQAA